MSNLLPPWPGGVIPLSVVPEVGQRLTFPDGGEIEIDMVEDGWVYYAVYPLGAEYPGLERLTVLEWPEAIRFTYEAAKRRAMSGR